MIEDMDGGPNCLTILDYILETISPYPPLRVSLVGGVEKWEDSKWESERKVRDQKKFSFHSYMFGWDLGEWKS